MAILFPANPSLEDVLELFEQHWTIRNCSLIEQFLAEPSLAGIPGLLIELVRVDIGRTYSTGGDLWVDEYFSRFPQLKAHQEHVVAVCYEDFRERRRRGRSCPVQRWDDFPAVHEQEWFKTLRHESVDLDSSGMFRVQNPAPSIGPLGEDSFGGESSPVPTSDREVIWLASNQPLVGQRPVSVATERHSAAAESPSGLFELKQPTPPHRMGDFELVSLLGVGAFSKVYLARQVSLAHRFVAIKVVSRPLKEATHLARLQHTGIVPLYSCHHEQGKWILCMPYSGSATLKDWMQRQTQPESRSGQSLIETVRTAQNRITTNPVFQDSPEITEANQATVRTLQELHHAAKHPLNQLATLPASASALWFSLRLASALSHAHQRGIVHGDLKPANIVIRNDGEPALIDFNLSQVVDAEPKPWRGGTMPYMSPEQLDCLMRQLSSAATADSDIYSLGIILFELIEGRYPFESPLSMAEVDLATALCDRKKDVKFVCRSTASEGLRSIVKRCLAFQPQDRYRNASELLNDLEREEAALPLQHAEEPLFRSRIPKVLRRYPRLFSSGSIAVVALLLLSVLASTVSHFRLRAQRLSAVESLQQFEDRSDEVFASFLLADASYRSISMEQSLTTDAVKSLLPAAMSFDDPAVDSQWKDLKSHLTDSEFEQAEQRLLALAFLHSLDLHSSVLVERPPLGDSAKDATGNLISQLLSDRAKQSWIELSRELKNGAVADQQILSLSGSDASKRPADTASDPANRILLAIVRLLTSQPDAAMEILESTEPTSALRLVYWMTRGRALLDLEEPRKAVAAFSMALRDAEDSAAVYLNRGLAHLRAGEINDADSDFTQSIRLAPERVGSYVNRYAVLTAMGRPADALLDLDKAIELQPQSVLVRLIRSRALRQAGRLKEAREDFDYAMQHRPESSNDWVAVALARLPHDPQQALTNLQTAETLFGANSTILQSMAHVYSEHLQQPEEAILVLDRLLEIQPAFQKAIAGRAVLHARKQQTDLALADVERLNSLPTPTTAESRYQMACALALCSETNPELKPKAMQFLARAVQSNYGADLMAADPDLESIRNEPDFELIQKSYLLLKE